MISNHGVPAIQIPTDNRWVAATDRLHVISSAGIRSPWVLVTPLATGRAQRRVVGEALLTLLVEALRAYLSDPGIKKELENL